VPAITGELQGCGTLRFAPYALIMNFVICEER